MLVGFFAVTALNDFILNKKFKYVDKLAGDHFETWIGHKWPRVDYQGEVLPELVLSFTVKSAGVI